MLFYKLKRAAVTLTALMTVLWCAAFVGAPASADAVYQAVLVDLDNCIPDSREAELTEYMQKTADMIECNIGVVITSNLDGKTDVRYSEGFLNDNFGRGSSSVVLMLLNTYDNPAYASYSDRISLDGRGYDYYDKKTDKIYDKLYDGLDSSGFEQAVRDFCDALVQYKGVGGGAGGSYAFSFEAFIGAFFFPALIGIVLSITITYGVAGKYTKKAPLSAVNYLDKNRTNATRKSDVFVREFTRTYTSSSGGSHGGGHSSHGGGHRSGGHSSHGGRHR